MRIKRIIFLLAIFCLVTAGYAKTGLRPQGWVSDFAGVINQQYKTAINALVSELESKTSSEIAVVTVSDLGGNSIEDYSVELFEEWGIGKKGKNNGVLFVAAIKDRRVRIEVGYGHEGIITDGISGEILDKYVLPEFKKNDYGRGMLVGTIVLANLIAKDAGVTLTGKTIQRGPGRKPTLLQSIFKIIFFFIMLIVFIRHPFLFLLFMGGGRGGGGGGFGGGFGGFGGGMSGGGGASRGW